MMGSGKTSVGRALAGRLGCPFIDLDRRIEWLTGRRVPELFAAEGEAAFRRRERAALASLLAEPGFARRCVVVATGGGVVVDPRNVDDMGASGVTVFLDPPLEVLIRRLSDDAQRLDRPLLAGQGAEALGARVARLLSDRRPEYERADLVDPGDETPVRVAERLLGQLPIPA